MRHRFHQIVCVVSSILPPQEISKRESMSETVFPGLDNIHNPIVLHLPVDKIVLPFHGLLGHVWFQAFDEVRDAVKSDSHQLQFKSPLLQSWRYACINQQSSFLYLNQRVSKIGCQRLLGPGLRVLGCCPIWVLITLQFSICGHWTTARKAANKITGKPRLNPILS